MLNLCVCQCIGCIVRSVCVSCNVSVCVCAYCLRCVFVCLHGYMPQCVYLRVRVSREFVCFCNCVNCVFVRLNVCVFRCLRVYVSMCLCVWVVLCLCVCVFV